MPLTRQVLGKAHAEWNGIAGKKCEAYGGLSFRPTSGPLHLLFPPPRVYSLMPRWLLSAPLHPDLCSKSFNQISFSGPSPVKKHYPLHSPRPSRACRNLKHHTAKLSPASSPNLFHGPLHSSWWAWESFLNLPSHLHPVRSQICPLEFPSVSGVHSLLSSSTTSA